MKPLRLMLAAGGTGGHFYPGLAVLDALRARTEVEVMFVGVARGIEARVVPQLGYPLTLVDVSPLNGVKGAAKLAALAKLPRAGWQCFRALRKFRPDAVLSVGGYTSGPVTGMAIATGVPVAVIEPNAVPGMTNRVLGKRVSRAYVAYEETARYFANGATRAFGNPVRRQFLDKAAAVQGGAGDVPHVLVTGGSQGARAINQVLPGAVAAARARGVAFTVTHQAGRDNAEAVARAYAERGIEGVEVVPFIDDVAAAMARADLLVCRAGAGTVSELGVIGRPAVFIPLPTAADDHQRKNAEAVAARGAGVCLEQRALGEEKLGEVLAALLADRAKLVEMGARARALGAPDAAEKIADDLLGMVGR